MARICPGNASFRPNRERIHRPVVRMAEIYTRSITGFFTCILGFSFVNESFMALPTIFLSVKALFVCLGFHNHASLS